MSVFVSIPESDGKRKGITPIEAFGYPCYIEELFKGCVLDIWEENGHEDSDFVALIWDEEKREPRKAMYASTRGWSYANSAVIDATPEVQEKAYAWIEKRWLYWLKTQEERKANQPTQGKLVRVVAGRKIPLGTEGLITWAGKTRFGEAVGIRIGTASILTSSNNVMVVNPEQYLPAQEVLAEQAHEARSNFTLFRM